jgi:predicted CXXCH cytochrome family protein
MMNTRGTPIPFSPLTLFGLLVMAMACLALPAIAQDSETDPDPGGGINQPEARDCAECHIDVVLAWQDGPHATTYSNPVFQAALVSAGPDATCLNCHATEYSAATRSFTYAAVSCRACHGETPAGHPEVPVSVPDGVTVCAECHTNTYQEWEAGGHGHAGIACTTCHNPHPQQLTFETTNALCLSCHEAGELSGFAHETHTDLTCSDCHWHYGESIPEAHVITGELGYSGHDTVVQTISCTNCHAEEFVAPATDGGEMATVVDRLTAAEYDAQIMSVRAQGENAAAVQLMQGIIVGTAIGAVLVFLFFRLRPGRGIKENNNE